jgi:hypothetical protein
MPDRTWPRRILLRCAGLFLCFNRRALRPYCTPTAGAVVPYFLIPAALGGVQPAGFLSPADAGLRFLTRRNSSGVILHTGENTVTKWHC